MSELPPGWHWRPVAECVLPVAKADPSGWPATHFTYVDIGSVNGETHAIDEVAEIECRKAPSRARQPLALGDTVFSTVRPYLEKIAYVGDPVATAIASTGFCILRPNPKILQSRFLFHFSTSAVLLDQVLPLQRGVSYPAIRDRDVLTAFMPVPSMAMQRRIVDILEDHLSRLDAARSEIDAATRRSASLALSIKSRVVDDLRVDARAERVGDLCTIGSGATPRRGNSAYWEGGTIPWITSGDLWAGVISEASQFVTQAALRETSIKLWPIGTLLVAMYGEGKTRGTVAELAIPATSNQACAALKLKRDGGTERAWLRLVLESSYERMRRASSGGVQPNLNLGYFRDLVVPWPDPEAMARAVDEVRAACEATARLVDTLRKVEKRESSLRRALLGAAFSGRLTGRSSDLDLAEELAAR